MASEAWPEEPRDPRKPERVVVSPASDQRAGLPSRGSISTDELLIGSPSSPEPVEEKKKKRHREYLLMGMVSACQRLKCLLVCA